MCQLFWMFVAQFSAWRLVSVPPNLYHSLVSENHFGNTVYIMIIRCSSLTGLFHEICNSLWWYILRCTLLNNFNSNEKNNYLVFILIMMQICFFKLSSTVLVVIRKCYQWYWWCNLFYLHCIVLNNFKINFVCTFVTF